MNNKLFLVSAAIVFSIVILGCAQQPSTNNSTEAINHAKQLPSVEEQTKYLVKEANAFINNDKFDEAIKTAKHVLAKLDANSSEAKSIVEKAKEELKALAEKKAAEVKDKLNEKLGNFGK